MELWASLVAQTVKRLPTMWETLVRSLGWEDPLEKEMATHSSILAWEIPRTEDPGSLQSMGSQRVRHNWATSLSFTLSAKWCLCFLMKGNLTKIELGGQKGELSYRYLLQSIRSHWKRSTFHLLQEWPYFIATRRRKRDFLFAWP